MNLSKSKYCSAVQCPKMLWLKTNKPEEFDESVINQNVLTTGNMVGDLAMSLLGDFVEVTTITDGKLDLKAMIEKTEVEVKNVPKILLKLIFLILVYIAQ